MIQVSNLNPFPEVALGCMYYGSTVDEQTAHRMIDMFLDAGETMLDTANNYAFWRTGTRGGESETVIGRWLARRGVRDDVIIATKIGARPTKPGGTLDDAEGLSAPVVRSCGRGEPEAAQRRHYRPVLRPHR